jgi:hypothetical protein
MSFGGRMWRRTVALCIACFIALPAGVGAVSVASGRGALINVDRVGGTSVVHAKSVATISVQCPAGAPHPVGADFGVLTAASRGQIVLAASYPTPHRGWSVSVLNLSAQPQSFGAAVICVAADTRFAYPRTTVVVGPHEHFGTQLQCPRFAPTPISSTFEPEPGARLGSAVVNWMSQTYTKTKQFTGKQSGGMLNLTGVRTRVWVGAVCSGLAITVRQASAAVSSQGANGFTFTCRPGQLAIGGVFFPARPSDYAALALDEMFRVSPSQWEVDVRNLATHPIRFTAGDVCAR